MIKPQTEMAFGQPIWDIYACEICGCLLLPSTAPLHSKYHESDAPQEEKFAELACPKCDLVLTLPLDLDGAMVLDDYDDHLETHDL